MSVKKATRGLFSPQCSYSHSARKPHGGNEGVIFPQGIQYGYFSLFLWLAAQRYVSESSAALRRWGTLENLGCRDFPRGWLFLFRVGTFSCCCPCQWGYWVPLFTIWDSVAGPGRTPMPGNNSGRKPSRAIEPRHRPPGQRWILDEGLRGGSPVGRPFGAR